MIALSFVFALAACSSNNAAAPTGDAGLDASDASDAPAETIYGDSNSFADSTPVRDSGGGCNSLGNTAPTVTDSYVAADFPSPSGGILADGGYQLTAIEHYSGKGGRTGAGTITLQRNGLLTGDTLQLVEKVGDALNIARTVKIHTSGTSFVWKPVCPTDEISIDYQFDATSTGFKLYDVASKTLYSYSRTHLLPGT